MCHVLKHCITLDETDKECEWKTDRPPREEKVQKKSSLNSIMLTIHVKRKLYGLGEKKSAFYSNGHHAVLKVFCSAKLGANIT